MAKAQIKQKRTFSLSPESLKYLEEIRKRKKATSTSSVLDEMIREQKLRTKMEKTDSDISAYYDSLTEQEQADDIAWGKFAMTQFPRE